MPPDSLPFELSAPSSLLRRLLSASYRRLQLLADTVICVAGLVLAYFLRFDFNLSEAEYARLVAQLPFVVLVQLMAMHLSGARARIWRYVSLQDMPAYFRAAFCATSLVLAVRFAPIAALDALRVPLSIIVIDAGLAFGGLVAARVSRRALDSRQSTHTRPTRGAVLVGAGRAGALAVRELRENVESGGVVPLAFVDDDPLKQGNSIADVRVRGRLDDLARVVEECGADEVILTIAEIRPAVRRRVAQICAKFDIPVREVPGFFELLQGRVSFSRLRAVSPEDLLNREPVRLEDARLRRVIQGRRILITGAGGSIGAELARQAVAIGPSAIGLLERAEPSLFAIESEILRLGPAAQVVPLLGDVSNEERMRWLLSEFKPDVVVHAAAHKHVPMMELHPGEAICNNVGGTLTMGRISAELGVGRFVLVSTDKAVNPTSVMGASKRLAEIAVEHLSGKTKTVFSTVRFGNVLDSAGSVIPIFRRQIRDGGPVTVTDPEMKRYFMSIPEAAQLVLQAGAIADGGEVFVLDMGEPVKIIDLARKMIELAGFEPEIDIPIKITGRRCGEKLFEEFGQDTENLDKTRHPKIFVGQLVPFPEDQFVNCVAELNRLSKLSDGEAIRQYLHEMLPEAQLDVELRALEHAD